MNVRFCVLPTVFLLSMCVQPPNDHDRAAAASCGHVRREPDPAPCHQQLDAGTIIYIYIYCIINIIYIISEQSYQGISHQQLDAGKPTQTHRHTHIYIDTNTHVYTYIHILTYSLKSSPISRSAISSSLDPTATLLPPASFSLPPHPLLLVNAPSFLLQYGTLAPPSPPPAPKRGDKKPLPPPPSPPQILYISLGHMPQLSPSLTQTLIDGLSPPQAPINPDGLSPKSPTTPEPLRVLWMLPPEQRDALPPYLPPNFRVKVMTELPHLQVRFQSVAQDEMRLKILLFLSQHLHT